MGSSSYARPSSTRPRGRIKQANGFDLNMGASTVEWTTHDPCMVLSESESILCIIFEFCEEKNHKHLRNILIYKVKKFIMKNKIT